MWQNKQLQHLQLLVWSITKAKVTMSTITNHHNDQNNNIKQATPGAATAAPRETGRLPRLH
jgi:hypothetical protein